MRSAAGGQLCEETKMTVCMTVTWVNYTIYIEVLKHFWLPCGVKGQKSLGIIELCTITMYHITHPSLCIQF